MQRETIIQNGCNALKDSAEREVRETSGLFLTVKVVSSPN